MSNKDLVATNFSKNAATYENAAKFQEEAAVDFGSKLRELRKDFFTQKKALELGAGTGFLSKELLKKLHLNSLKISDISDEMLQVCKNNLQRLEFENTKISFEHLNFNDPFLEEECFDLVVSAMSLQWAADLSLTIEFIANILKKNGMFCFTTLTDQTFKKLKAAFDGCGLDYPGPLMLSKQDIVSSCDFCFKEIQIEISDYRVKYNSLLDFLRAVKQTGAANATGELVSLAKLRAVMREYEKINNSKFSVADYQVATVICFK